MPPAALTPIPSPTAPLSSLTSSTVAPPGPKPVDVFTKSAPAALARMHPATFCSSLSKAVSRMTLSATGRGLFRVSSRTAKISSSTRA